MNILVITSGKKDYAPTRIMQEGLKRKHKMHIVHWEDLYIKTGFKDVYVSGKNISLSHFHAIIPRSAAYKIKLGNQKIPRYNREPLFRLVLQYAQFKKIYFLNQDFFINYKSGDKLTQQFYFSQKGIPGISSLYFSNLATVKTKDRLKFPFIAKPIRGSMGDSLVKVHSRKELDDFMSRMEEQDRSCLFQEYLKINCDYRVLVVEGVPLGIMKRTPLEKGEWRTNFSLGGKVEKVTEDEAITKTAIQVAKKMSFDYVGVDILKYRGKPHVIETNSFAQFKGFEKTFPAINVAREIICFLERKLNKSK